VIEKPIEQIIEEGVAIVIPMLNETLVMVEVDPMARNKGELVGPSRLVLPTNGEIRCSQPTSSQAQG
jgi:hypothetical protein